MTVAMGTLLAQFSDFADAPAAFGSLRDLNPELSRGAARKSGRFDDRSGGHRENRCRGPHDSGGLVTPSV